MTPPPTTPTPKRERLNMGELKPCPLCNSPALLERDNDHHGAWFNLGCSVGPNHAGDGACILYHAVYTEDAANEAETVLAWNTRPRTEGRGEGKPVAWAYEYTNHLKGDRAPGGWLRAVAFEAPARARVNAGFARNVQPLYASPIREPEISREAVEAALVEYEWALSTAGWPKTAAEITARTVDAILNLAPVGGRGAVSAPDRAFVRHLIREMRSAIADDPNDATITTGPLDPDILERVLNVALGAQEQGGEVSLVAASMCARCGKTALEICTSLLCPRARTEADMQQLRDWLERRVHLEDGCEIGAGFSMADGLNEESQTNGS